MAHPILTERSQSIERLNVLCPPSRGFAADDVVQMTNRKSLDSYPTLPGVFKPLDSVRRKDQIQIEWTIIKLNKIFSTLDLSFSFGC